MDYKRVIYISLSILSLILPPLLMVVFTHEPAAAFFGLVFYMLYILIHLLVAIMAFDEIPELDDFITALTGILSLRLKQIYYTDLGYFYVRHKNGKVIIYKQKVFILEMLFQTYFEGDVSSLQSDIKNNLEIIYKNKLEEKRKKDAFNSWDGYIDSRSRRDSRIKQILK